MMMPFGKYKGRPLTELPADYLRWLLTLNDLRPHVAEALRAENERRSFHRAEKQWSSEQSAPMALRIVKAGYRQLAKQLHPDHGGSTQAMQELNLAYEKLCGHINT